MMKGRILYDSDIRDHNKLGVYGIFDTKKVIWEYFVIYYISKNNEITLTAEICTYGNPKPTFDDIKRYGMKVNEIEVGKKFILDYKSKWESGLNVTTQEDRDRKLNEILDNENTN